VVLHRDAGRAEEMWTRKVMERRLHRLTAVLVLSIAGLAFMVSFEAIREYAARSGAVSPALAWIIPLLVDTFIIVASLSIWLRSLSGERSFFGSALLISAACGSLLLNIAHAPENISARAVAVIPPAALIASFHVVMGELRRAYRRRLEKEEAELAARIAAEAEAGGDELPGRTTVTAERYELAPPRFAASEPSPSATSTYTAMRDARELVRQLWEEHELRNGELLTGAAIEKMSGGQINRRRAQTYLKSLRAEQKRGPTNFDLDEDIEAVFR
jgi:Protein of unknown function (DUF2637)